MQHMAEMDARVPLKSETRDRLRELKEDNDRYDDVIQRLLKSADTNN